MTPNRRPGYKDGPKIVGPAPPPASHALKPHRPPGLYEELVTRRLETALEEIRGEGWRDEVEQLDPAEAPGVLARFVHDLVEPLLGSLSGDDRTARQLEIVNNLVDHLQSAVKDSPVLDDDALAPPARQLLSLVDPSLHGVGEATSPTRPSIPLASSHLLINGPRDHTVSSEIKRELASADRVDLLVSFLEWSCWRLLRDEARRFLDRHPDLEEEDVAQALKYAAWITDDQFLPAAETA